MNNIHKPFTEHVCKLLAAGLLFASGSAYGEKVYRWEDQGLTTYQDRAPSSNQDDGHAILNNQGVVLENVLSREQRRERRRAERDAELARIRDRALLATFTTEEDLTRTRDDRFGMIDGLISRLDDRIRILSDRLAVVEKRILIQAWSLIDSKAAERSEVTKKFEDDLTRYRELKTAMGRIE